MQSSLPGISLLGNVFYALDLYGLTCRCGGKAYSCILRCPSRWWENMGGLAHNLMYKPSATSSKTSANLIGRCKCPATSCDSLEVVSTEANTSILPVLLTARDIKPYGSMRGDDTTKRK